LLRVPNVDASSSGELHYLMHPMGSQTLVDPSRQRLGQWLLAQELANGGVSEDEVVAAAERACHKLGDRLARLLTMAGYQALLARSLYLAKARFQFLDGVGPGAAPDTCLDGLRERARDVEPTQLQEGIGAVLANLIGLLDTFIGEDLALRLVREAWPDAPRPNNTDSETQEARS